MALTETEIQIWIEVRLCLASDEDGAVLSAQGRPSRAHYSSQAPLRITIHSMVSARTGARQATQRTAAATMK